MGYYFSSILSIKNYCFKKKFTIPLTGLEECGITSIINKLRTDMGLIMLPPHLGITYSVNYKRFHLEKYLPLEWGLLWKYYMKEIYAIILVLDSCDKEMVKESAELFWEIFAKAKEKFPILILANKQDRKEALSLDDICFIFNLKNFSEKTWKIVGTNIYNSKEIYKGLNWLDSLL